MLSIVTILIAKWDNNFELNNRKMTWKCNTFLSHILIAYISFCWVFNIYIFFNIWCLEKWVAFSNYGVVHVTKHDFHDEPTHHELCVLLPRGNISLVRMCGPTTSLAVVDVVDVILWPSDSPSKRAVHPKLHLILPRGRRQDWTKILF